MTTNEFWEWFKHNNAGFFFLNQIDNPAERERLLDEFAGKLHEFCDSLYFEIGAFPDDTQELIITAGGNVENYKKVEELVRQAPKLKGWNVIAFKPPAEEEFVIEYEGVKIDPKSSWFMPLEHKTNPSLFGIRVYIENYVDSRKEQFLNAAYLVLDSLLGEKANTRSIQRVEVAALPENPESLGLIEFLEIPAYLRWKKAKEA